MNEEKYYLHVRRDGYVCQIIKARVDFVVEGEAPGDMLIKLDKPIPEEALNTDRKMYVANGSIIYEDGEILIL